MELVLLRFRLLYPCESIVSLRTAVTDFIEINFKVSSHHTERSIRSAIQMHHCCQWVPRDYFYVFVFWFLLPPLVFVFVVSFSLYRESILLVIYVYQEFSCCRYCSDSRPLFTIAKRDLLVLLQSVFQCSRRGGVVMKSKLEQLFAYNNKQFQYGFTVPF